MTHEWTIGTFIGEQAKNVIAHAGAGIGYFIQNQGGAGQSFTVNAAFLRPTNEPLPDNCVPANRVQVSKLNAMRESRQGTSHNESLIKRSTASLEELTQWSKHASKLSAGKQETA